jgi:hypothetical protein
MSSKPRVGRGAESSKNWVGMGVPSSAKNRAERREDIPSWSYTSWPSLFSRAGMCDERRPCLHAAEFLPSWPECHASSSVFPVGSIGYLRFSNNRKPEVLDLDVGSLTEFSAKFNRQRERKGPAGSKRLHCGCCTTERDGQSMGTIISCASLHQYGNLRKLLFDS